MNVTMFFKRSLACTGIFGRRNFSNVGFVGLGNMGGHMARNLLKKGYKLIVYDVNKVAVKSLVEAGAESAESSGKIAANAEVVVSMLPTNKHVLDCYTGADGILSSVNKNTLLIDSSTIDPSVSQIVAKQAEKSGAKFLDGPVSGGVNAARAATLTFMIGGSKAAFEEAKQLLEAMGSKIVHCGDVGMGQAAKLCNNMLLGISMIGTAEAFNLGQKLGLESKVLADIINSSTGRCWACESYNPVPGILPNVPSSNNYKAGFVTSLMAKDLGLAQAAATRTEAPIPLGSLAHQLFRTLMASGHSDKDFTIVYKFLKGQEQ